jgi:hypothetical protein
VALAEEKLTAIKPAAATASKVFFSMFASY